MNVYEKGNGVILEGVTDLTQYIYLSVVNVLDGTNKKMAHTLELQRGEY